MNEWKFQMRRRKRGLHCLICYKVARKNPATGKMDHGSLCGCGIREDPPKAKKTRIVKRALARQLSREVAEPAT